MNGSTKVESVLGDEKSVAVRAEFFSKPQVTSKGKLMLSFWVARSTEKLSEDAEFLASL